MAVRIRPIRSSDYLAVIAVIDDWWGGRHMADMLPRLFFDHFTDTSFAAERASGAERVSGVSSELAGFLVGFQSQSHPAEAYIHFVGIHPGEAGPDGIAVAAGYDGDGQDRVRFVKRLAP